MAMAIDDVRVTLGVDRVSLIGSSYGGFLSLLYAHQNPGSVAALILADTSASYGFRQQSLVTAKQRCTPSMLRALERLWDGSLESDEDFHADWCEVLPLYFHHLSQEEIERIADHSSYQLETRKQVLPSLRDYDLRHELSTIEAPSLVMVGRHDWITSVAQAEELAAGIPNSELVVFEKSGHYPFIEENGAFLRQVRDWLRTHGV